MSRDTYCPDGSEGDLEIEGNLVVAGDAQCAGAGCTPRDAVMVRGGPGPSWGRVAFRGNRFEPDTVGTGCRTGACSSAWRRIVHSDAPLAGDPCLTNSARPRSTIEFPSTAGATSVVCDAADPPAR
jgi:hypothetical protein